MNDGAEQGRRRWTRRGTKNRAKVISIKSMRRQMKLRDVNDPTSIDPARVIAEYDRPKTRADCVGGCRPCPFVSCRYNLFLDVDKRTGSLKLNHPSKEIEDLPESCALDVADRGGITLEAVAALLNVTRERVRQLEDAIIEKIQSASPDLEIGDFPEAPTGNYSEI